MVSVCSDMMVSHRCFISSSISAGFWKDSARFFYSSIFLDSIVLIIDCLLRISEISSLIFLRLSESWAVSSERILPKSTSF